MSTISKRATEFINVSKIIIIGTQNEQENLHYRLITNRSGKMADKETFIVPNFPVVPKFTFSGERQPKVIGMIGMDSRSEMSRTRFR